MSTSRVTKIRSWN